MLVAASARLLVAKRTRTRYVRRQDSGEWRSRPQRRTSSKVMQSPSLHATALRALQKQSADADTKESPEMHRELYEMCGEYLAGAGRALQSPSVPPDGRVALRAGQERVRNLQRHHLLTWARGAARALTHEAQQRVRLYEKLDTANRALDCLDTALKVYPDDEELRASDRAVREFMTSSRVAHWVELAERAAFKGHYQRAIDCYQDALFYLTRDRPEAAGEAAAERITREIDLLKARVDTEDVVLSSSQRRTRNRRPRTL